MPGRRHTASTAQHFHKLVARRLAAHNRAWVAGPACLINLARGNPLQPDARSFGAPNRTIAIPDARGRAGERGTGGNNWGDEKKYGHSNSLLAADAVAIPVEMGTIARIATPNGRRAGRTSC
jgi:hypothetical protein